MASRTLASTATVSWRESRSAAWRSCSAGCVPELLGAVGDGGLELLVPRLQLRVLLACQLVEAAVLTDGVEERRAVVDGRDQVGVVPRLREEQVDAAVVDGVLCGLHVRIAGERDAVGVGARVVRAGEDLVPGHAGHPLVADQDGDLAFVEDPQCGLAGGRGVDGVTPGRSARCRAFRIGCSSSTSRISTVGDGVGGGPLTPGSVLMRPPPRTRSRRRGRGRRPRTAGCATGRSARRS